MIAWAQRLWISITEPRHLKVLYAAIYLVAAVTGILALFWPPRSVEGALGEVLTAAWAISLLVGGTLGAMCVFPGWWAFERIGITLILTGLSIYAVVLMTIHISEEGSRYALVGMTALAASVFVVRLISIRWYTFEPRTGMIPIVREG